MLAELLPYYERELGSLRDLAREFAERYPKVARRLAMEDGGLEDPHVGRLVESFAFLAARLHRKLDDEFPLVAESLLASLLPQALHPIPSACIAALEAEPDAPPISVPAQTTLQSPEIHGRACRFQSTQSTMLWPIRVMDARLERAHGNASYGGRRPPKSVLRLHLQSQGEHAWTALKIPALEFHLEGEASQVALLYELLAHHVVDVRAGHRAGERHSLGDQALLPMGFEDAEALLPETGSALGGARLVLEYLALPEKFHFFRLSGLDRLAAEPDGRDLWIDFWMDRLDETEAFQRLLAKMGPSSLQLGCLPAINLFPLAGEPFQLKAHQDAYPLVGDARQPLTTEVIRVEEINVSHRGRSGGRSRWVAPFHAPFRLASGTESAPWLWVVQRNASLRKGDRGTDVSIRFVAQDGHALSPEGETVSSRIWCSNRDLPESLASGRGAEAAFQVPQIGLIRAARLVRRPTPALRPEMGGAALWRLIAFLQVTQHSLVAEGPEVLKGLLTALNLGRNAGFQALVEGIQAVESHPATARIRVGGLPRFVRGLEVSLTMESEALVGTNRALFGAVLAHLLARQAPPNTFVQLRLRVAGNPEPVLSWPPLQGDRRLL